MRALGLDLGEKRIGVALSDSAGTMATPYELVQRSGSRERDHARIAALAEEAGAELIVVGLPLSLDGSKGPAVQNVEAELAELREHVPLPFETWDERLSTVEATRRLRAAGVRGPRRRQLVDQVAATVILQSWLDANLPRR
ncbi:MAG TPA: Holliday junction resolvase RuvX [Acidimicrobiales bacterium]|nr:Holliday junction resolvase RuvX [Acidimicrobiales bacterium]